MDELKQSTLHQAELKKQINSCHPGFLHVFVINSVEFINNTCCAIFQTDESSPWPESAVALLHGVEAGIGTPITSNMPRQYSLSQVHFTLMYECEHVACTELPGNCNEFRSGKFNVGLSRYGIALIPHRTRQANRCFVSGIVDVGAFLHTTSHSEFLVVQADSSR